MQRHYLPFKITARNGIFVAFTTFTCVNITWVFFRANNFKTALNIIGSMFYLNPEGEKVLGSFDILQVGVTIAILFLSHWFMRNTSVEAVSKKISPISLAVIWAIMFFLVAIAQGSGEQFIYFQF